MVQENSQELILKNIDGTGNYFLEEMEQKELMKRKDKKVCSSLIYIEDSFILASTIIGCISISAFLLGLVFL